MRSADTIHEIGETPELEDLIRLAMRAQSLGLRVGVPARVKSFDPGPPVPFVTAEIHLARVLTTERRDGEEVSAYPPIPLCPVEYPRGGGYRICWNLNPGDGGWLKFSDRALEVWLDADSAVDPKVGRLHALSDAVFVPGLHNRANPALTPVPAAGLTIEREDGTAAVEIDALSARIRHDALVNLGNGAGLANARVTDPTILNATDILEINKMAAAFNLATPGQPVLAVPIVLVTGTGSITAGSAKVFSE